MIKAAETFFTLGLVTVLMAAVLLSKMDPDSFNSLDADLSST